MGPPAGGSLMRAAGPLGRAPSAPGALAAAWQLLRGGAGTCTSGQGPRPALTCSTRSFLSLVKGFFSSDQMAKYLESGPVWGAQRGG
jgi:hypothetical protein